MKNLILALCIVLAATQIVSAKKDKTDPKDVKIDSLTKAADTLSKQVNTLTIKLDSVSKELVKYSGMYITIKEKVLKRDFDPEKLSYIIDSLRASRDSASTGFAASASALMDSVAALQKENSQLKATLTGMSDEETTKNRLVYELKQLKELLDAKILTPSEFDSKKAKLLQKWE